MGNCTDLTSRSGLHVTHIYVYDTWHAARLIPLVPEVAVQYAGAKSSL